MVVTTKLQQEPSCHYDS